MNSSEKKNRYTIQKRQEGYNNTHNNLVDESIEDIFCFKYVKFYHFKMILYNLLTVGLLYILCRFYRKLHLKIYCNPCQIHDTDLFLVEDHERRFFLVEAHRENFQNKYKFLKKAISANSIKNELKNSIYIGDESLNKSEDHIILYFKNSKYIFLDSIKRFAAVQLDLRIFTNAQIYEKFSNGIKTLAEYNYLLNKFGENIMKMKDKTFFKIIRKRFFSPLILYIIFIFVVWTKTGYYSFLIVVVWLTTMLLLITSYQKYLNYKRVFNENDSYEIPMMEENIDLKSKLSIWKQGSNYKLNQFTLKYFYNIKNLASKPSTVKSLFLVPGDVIYLDPRKKVPCDCLILDGHCSVLESYLTGESNHILKEALPRDNLQFSFESGKSILFQGTEIIECESNLMENGSYYIKCLVLSTGYNTYWGSFLQNILFPKKMNFKFYRELKIFINFMLILYAFTISVLTYSFITKKAKIKEKLQGDELQKFIDNELSETFAFIIKCVDLLTVIIQPSLHICLNVITVYFNIMLKKKQITCLSHKRLNAAGKVNTIVLDKTGTLTTDGLEISGFQSTSFKEKLDCGKEASEDEGGLEYDLGVVEKSLRIFNSMHREFWMRFAISSNNDFYNDYQVNLLNNPVYFVECLGTCLSIDMLKDKKILGNALDKILFQEVGWVIEKIDEMWNDFHINYQISPKQSYKITEQLNFNENTKNLRGKKYNLKVIRRFEFSSVYQSNSVIIKNELDNTCRFYIKGAPEKIKNICLPETLPANFNEILKNHTKKGYRVLACATKPLQESTLIRDMQNDYFEKKNSSHVINSDNTNSNDNKNKKQFRDLYENKLIFLGFVIISNQLKTDTTNVIKQLKESGCHNVMATGDNPFTSISVAKQCGLIDDENVCLIDLEDKQLYLNWIDEESEIDDESFFKRINNQMKNENERAVIEVDKGYNRTYTNQSKKKIIFFNDKNDEFLSENKSRKLLDNQDEIDTKAFSSMNREISAVAKNINYNKYNKRQSLNPFATVSRSMDNLEFFTDYKDCNAISICLSGNAFKYLIEKISKYEKIRDCDAPEFERNLFCKIIPQFISKKTKIFYRMSPDDKVKLINFLKRDPNAVVAMCGDGANDCGALLCADIGISLNDSQSTKRITSHFSFKLDSIACIEIILRYGRACFENNVMILKYILLYSALQLTIVLCLYQYNRDLTNKQYFYQDCLVSLISCILAAKTGPRYKLFSQNRSLGILDKKFLYTMIGHLIIQPIMFMGVFFFFKEKRNLHEVDEYYEELYLRKNSKAEIMLEECPYLLINYVYLFNCFQIMVLLFIFNINSKHRKYFYSNKIYIFYLSLIALITIDFITSLRPKYNDYFKDTFVFLDNFDKINAVGNESNRLFLILFIVVNGIISYLWENLFDLIMGKDKDNNDN